MNKFINLETGRAKESLPDLSDALRKGSSPVTKNHQKFLDKVFEIIINHPYPVARFKYWKDLGPEYK